MSISPCSGAWGARKIAIFEILLYTEMGKCGSLSG